MPSRRGEALRTETMQRLLSVFLPPSSYYRWQDGTEAIDGVYLVSDDMIHIDSHRREYREGEADWKQVRRRVIVRVEVVETDVSR